MAIFLVMSICSVTIIHKALFITSLMMVYIKNIIENISSNVRLFADDTSLYIIVDNQMLQPSNLILTYEKIKWAI